MVSADLLALCAFQEAGRACSNKMQPPYWTVIICWHLVWLSKGRVPICLQGGMDGVPTTPQGPASLTDSSTGLITGLPPTHCFLPC